MMTLTTPGGGGGGGSTESPPSSIDGKGQSKIGVIAVQKTSIEEILS